MFALICFIYFVSFLDKPEKTAPQLSPRAIEQRAKWNIPTDQMDYPVSPMYTDSLRRMGVKIHHKSRWFNGVTCEMKEEMVSRVQQLSFVTAVEMTRDNSTPIYGTPERKSKRLLEQTVALLPQDTIADLTYRQLALFNLHPLHQAGFKGQGILMAVCDGGFTNANTLSCFRQSQELGHFDFTDDTDGFYGSSGTHGTACLSVISAQKNNFHGAAPRSDYYLMRSEEIENNRESPKEMDNLVAALEKADSLGVNVFSVSLGYAMFDNSDWTLDKTADLDGRTTRCSQAATIAARKGMLVCVAVGNEGAKPWQTINAPSDADSILAVGAVDVDSVIGSFSSQGPSSDGRIKPDVCAVGVQTAIIRPDGSIANSNGTSFATPLIAGLAASLWSALPDENAMRIRDRIIRSANRYTTPDSIRYGYGIPDAWQAYTMYLPEGLTPVNGHSISNRTPDAARKIIRGNQILIVRFGHIYNLAGQKIE